MNLFCTTLLSELDDHLIFIATETDDTVKKAELSISTVVKQLEKLRAFIHRYKFKNESEEITFFKENKPLFVSKLIYHIKIYNIESKRPRGGDKVLKKYLQNELDKLKRYFDSNLEFYRYYRTGSSYLDYKYFVRGNHDIRLNIDSFFFETDKKFCTSHDYKVSTILANDLLQIYLENQLSLIDRKEIKPQEKSFSSFGITWTDSKTSLIELIYALHSQGVFDNGKADIKQIANFMQTAFNIDLGDYYRTYLEIRIRKSGRTKFLLQLQDSLTKRMDDQDEK